MPEPLAQTPFPDAPQVTAAPPRGPRAPDRLADNQRSFAAALGRADARRQSAPDRARDAAEQFVTQTLILPLLKQLRANNQAAPPFAPTQTERQFGALQDAETAQRIAHATRFPLVDRLARDLLQKAGLDTPELSAPLLSSPVISPAMPAPIPGTARRASPR
jgi:hypothetical protein